MLPATFARERYKGTVSRAPLHNVPVVNIPFEKVAIDLIGPNKPVSVLSGPLINIIHIYRNKFIIQWDHQPLAYLQTSKLSNNRIMRWAIKLQPYSFTVETIPGKRNFGADFLSRC